MQYRYWQSVENRKWYWHFLDSDGYIRFIGGQYFESSDDVVTDIRECFALVGGRSRSPSTTSRIRTPSDPRS